MIYFVGAGSGAVDLITVRGANLLRKADVIIYAGSLVNPELISEYAKADCEICDSAAMTLQEISAKMLDADSRDLLVVRLHSGDPAIFGAINEQMRILRDKNVAFEIVPGVSSFCAAAASLQVEYTIPDLTQSLIISRHSGRTPVPERESLRFLASHGCSMAIFLSAGMLREVCAEIIAAGNSPETPAALAYKISWRDERIISGNLRTLPELVESSGIAKTGIILVGKFLDGKNFANKSRLYDANFSHEFRGKI